MTPGSRSEPLTGPYHPVLQSPHSHTDKCVWYPQKPRLTVHNTILRFTTTVNLALNIKDKAVRRQEMKTTVFPRAYCTALFSDYFHHIAKAMLLCYKSRVGF